MKATIKLSLLAFIVSLSLAATGIYGQGTGKHRSGDRSELLATTPAVSTTLMISQVYGGGGANSGTPTYTKDYVEIKNVSSSPQSLSGLSLYYGSATGQFASSSGNAFALPDVTLQAGQYFLVATGPEGTVGGALTGVDATTVNLTMGAASGKIALVNGLAANTCGATATPCSLPNAQIIDLVAWGTANNAEGGAAVSGGTTLTNEQASIRKGGGCTDTDNNNSDFEVVNGAVPRNSSSPAAPCGPSAVRDAPGDFNGDGRTDFSIVRPGPGGGADKLTWWIRHNGVNTSFVTSFGLNSDFFVPADYDGDGSDDIAIWRSTGGSGFWVLRSSDNTVTFSSFGQPGDDPFVVADYTNDGTDDLAIFRKGDTSSEFWFNPSSGPYVGQFAVIPWGFQEDIALFGDYNGDGFADFTVVREENSRSVVYTRFGSLDLSFAGSKIELWGLPTDFFLPGDYDGDGATDLAVSRYIGSNIRWIIKPSGGGPIQHANWGLNATDLEAHGDYDGDGKTDLAIWRQSGALAGFFIVRLSNGGVMWESWGAPGDSPTIWEFK